MFKKLALAALSLVLCSAAAHAEMVRCRTSPNGWCEMRPAMVGPGGIRRMPVILAPRIAMGTPVATRGGYFEEHHRVDVEVNAPAIHRSGPKFGTAADIFPVSGIREGERFDGVSNPDAASRCVENGGRLVAQFIDVMPNGQSRYKNTCIPRDGG